MNNTNETTKWIRRIIVIMLLIIIITLLAPAIYMLFAHITGKNTTVNINQDGNSISVLLSMVGIAVTAWVGLNIYNVFNKNELVALIEEANRSMDLVSQQSFTSKLRNSFTDHAGCYFAKRIESAEILPKNLLEDLIIFQDLYNNQHEQYKNISSTSENWTTIQLGRRIEKDISEDKYILKTSTKKLLLGYLYFCLGLLEYSPVQYNEVVKVEKIRGSLKDIVNYEKMALNILFTIESLENMNAILSYSPNERKIIALICNCIGSIYLVAFNNNERILVYSAEEKQESISYMEMAIKFSDDFATYIQEVFYRNLGSAYMMIDKDDLALDALKNAYILNRNNPKLCADFGEFYLRKIEKEFPNVILYNDEKLYIDNDLVKELYDDKENGLIGYLENALYWYELHFYYGFIKDYHVVRILANTLFALTGNQLYETIWKNADRINRCLVTVNTSKSCEGPV